MRRKIGKSLRSCEGSLRSKNSRVCRVTLAQGPGVMHNVLVSVTRRVLSSVGLCSMHASSLAAI